MKKKAKDIIFLPYVLLLPKEKVKATLAKGHFTGITPRPPPSTAPSEKHITQQID